MWVLVPWCGVLAAEGGPGDKGPHPCVTKRNGTPGDVSVGIDADPTAPCRYVGLESPGSSGGTQTLPRSR